MQWNRLLPSRSSIRRLRRALMHPLVLSFMTGVFLALLLFANWQDRYEDRLFQSLAARVQGTNALPLPDDSLFIRALHLSHGMLVARSATFNGDRSGWIEYFQPLSTDLMTAEGACGSYSLVLCRVLQKLNYPVRLAHMEDDAHQVCHIVVEARSATGWVVLDPLYDLYFQKPGGGLASFGEVSNAWPWYQKQTPPNYDRRYHYAGVSYTNWNKIPVLMPLAKAILGLFIENDQLDHLSLRTLLLRKFRVLEYILLLPLVLTATLLARQIRRSSVRSWRLAPLAGVPSRKGEEINEPSSQLFLNRYLKPSNNPKE